MPALNFVPQGGWGLLKTGEENGLFTDGMTTCAPLIIYNSDPTTRVALMHCDAARVRLPSVSQVLNWVCQGIATNSYTVLGLSKDLYWLLTYAGGYRGSLGGFVSLPSAGWVGARINEGAFQLVPQENNTDYTENNPVTKDGETGGISWYSDDFPGISNVLQTAFDQELLKQGLIEQGLDRQTYADVVSDQDLSDLSKISTAVTTTGDQFYSVRDVLENIQRDELDFG
ncbi:hypothetical protein JM93_01569 [Roseibium hamelinense]|uniref:Uncharacterized protein n=1 Tax=Roseibium hamelinense TaxID=150831 RepID=A0A562T8V6_9HYPH|nr:hypothetical protein [Roseibium hamelinense]MTI43687.1 hypothetical protein [Roseibium hamelinense]TWI89366.1 hypothetical protein JM93_01569 [Roseibium hamelinense]